MATQNQDPNQGHNPNQQENKHTPNPHEHPQNASGNAGKELSSDQNQPEFDQSKENETHINEAHFTQSKMNPTNQVNQQNNAAQTKPRSGNTPETTGQQGLEPTEKDPVDRPIKDENGELL